MHQRDFRILVGIIILALVAAWISLPNNPGIHVKLGPLELDRDLDVKEGLDLVGGLQLIMEPDVPAGTPVTSDSLIAARDIIERRINALGVSEPVINVAERSIVIQMPGVEDPDQAVRTIGETGQLEFIDAGTTFLPVGTVVTTTLGGPRVQARSATATQLVTPTVTAGATSPTVAATETITGTTPVSPTVPTATDQPEKVYKSIVTGGDLDPSGINVGFDEVGKPEILFAFKGEGVKTFGDFTTANQGKYLAIVLDKTVISSPTIQSPITEGKGRITGTFKLEEAQGIVIQLKYGALPIALKVMQNYRVGPTLGADSLNRSLIAGAVGLGIVVLFMLIYYRLPGLMANLALITYALVVFSLFKLIPVVITVPGIAGFILSIGMAVDANILIFERMKEELRAGKTVGAALDAGFRRAWTSIRDSNVSTLITTVILFWFGSSFGASIIMGFALTLAIGVLVSMFTAYVVSRTFLRLFVGSDIVKSKLWFVLD